MMAIRAFDSTLVALILSGSIFSGVVFLIIDIPIFNPVNSTSLAIVVLALLLGLAFGVFAGNLYTKDQLKILSEKNEFRGLGSKRTYYALFSGFAVFLIWAFFAIYYKLPDLGNSLVVFTISATFTMCLGRLILISSWEKHNKKIVLMEWNNRVYAISNHPVNPPT
ncbi:MAG: hypothetical protein NWE98_09140 [Candidatus Bathyarchaeota archaeon]|nr:hypothetical protein [Candidatus Bathyarchaeota archaeon]